MCFISPTGRTEHFRLRKGVKSGRRFMRRIKILSHTNDSYRFTNKKSYGVNYDNIIPVHLDEKPKSTYRYIPIHVSRTKTVRTYSSGDRTRVLTQVPSSQFMTFCLNYRSIKNKTVSLRDFILGENVDVFLVGHKY